MNSDDFEKQLQRQPLRQIPSEWRDEILSVARNAEAAGAAATSLDHPRAASEMTASWWREWLWPCPEAWAGLAAVWLVILGVNVTAPSPETQMAAKPLVPQHEVSTQLAEQRRELARLLDLTLDSTPAARPGSPPGPRSEGPSPSKA